MTKRTELLIILFLLLLAFALRWGYIQEIKNSSCYGFFTIQDTDMFANLEWANEILNGDIWGRDTYHPFFPWMQRVGTYSDWNRWINRKVFHQSPLYPYMLAGVFCLFGKDPFLGQILNVFLSTLLCFLIYLIAYEIMDEVFALIALLLSTIYSLFVYYAEILLRTTLVMTTQMLFLYLFLVFIRNKKWLTGFFGGFSFGLALLAKPNIAIFLPLIFLLVALFDWFYKSFQLSNLLKKCLVISAGLIVSIAPLLYRNHLVGAPLFAFSTRGALGFIVANSPEAGLYHFPPFAVIRELLEKSEGKTFKAIIETSKKYSNPFLIFTRYMKKVILCFSSWEVPNNENFYFFKKYSAILKWTIKSPLISALAIIGIFLTFLQNDKRWLIIHLFLMIILFQFFFARFLSRYKVMIYPILILYAVFALKMAYIWLRERGFFKFAIFSLIFAILVLAIYSYPFPHWFRAEDYFITAYLESNRGRYEKSILLMDEALKIARQTNAPEGAIKILELKKKEYLHRLLNK